MESMCVRHAQLCGQHVLAVDLDCTPGSCHRMEAHPSQAEDPFGLVRSDPSFQGVDLHVDSSETTERVAISYAPSAPHII